MNKCRYNFKPQNTNADKEFQSEVGKKYEELIIFSIIYTRYTCI